MEVTRLPELLAEDSMFLIVAKLVLVVLVIFILWEIKRFFSRRK